MNFSNTSSTVEATGSAQIDGKYLNESTEVVRNIDTCELPAAPLPSWPKPNSRFFIDASPEENLRVNGLDLRGI
jgi:hypothetical protein